MAAGAGRGYERIGVGYRRHRRTEPAGQQASVAALPFPDAGFDAALAVLTVHHWTDPLAGLAEMQQVDRRQVVLTWDPEVVAERFWFARDYLPEALERERGLPTVEAIAAALRGEHRVEVLAVPHDCRDGVFAAYLDPDVRAAMSACTVPEPGLVARAVRRLVIAG